MDFSGLFVLIGDGDYEEIQSFEGSVPYLNKDLGMINSHWVSGSRGHLPLSLRP
jgi:hypothetical protein